MVILREMGLAVSAAVVLGSTIATGASAATLASGSTTCNISDLTGSINCEGAYNGNASPDIPGEAFFGFNDWTEFLKVDSDSGTDGGLTVTGGGTTGNWGLTDFGGYETVMIALKGGPTFSVYLLGDVESAATSGTWNTNGILEGNGSAGPGLSNVTAWGRGSATPPSVVPLPAAGWLLLAGIGGLVTMKRRKRTDA